MKLDQASVKAALTLLTELEMLPKHALANKDACGRFSVVMKTQLGGLKMFLSNVEQGTVIIDKVTICGVWLL